MTVTIDQAVLNDALKTVLPITGKGGTLPIFSGVRIQPALDGLELCCTDGDLTISVHVSTSGGTLQSTVVPARLFASYVGTLRGEVTLTQDDADLIVSCGKTSLSMRTMFSEDFPQTADATEGEQFQLTPEVRAELGHILYAASRDNARPVLCGVGFGDGHAACTDSYRLAAVEVPDMPKTIIPARALELALKFGCSMLWIDDRRATFMTDTVTITTRLIEGTYPNWRALIPASTPSHITVERDTLLAAIERVGVLVRNDEPVRLQVVDGDLQLSVRSQDVGEASETIPCDSDFDGVIGFNGRYMGELLKASDEGNVVFGLENQSKPACVKVGGLVQLIMPVRCS